jgi:hypothetical protein
MRGCFADDPVLARACGFGAALGLAAALSLVTLSTAPAKPMLSAENAVPKPPPRPSEAQIQEKSLPAAPPSTPVPPPRPPDLGASTPAESPPQARGDAPPEESACRERLTQLGVRYEPLPPIRDGVCGADWPLRVSALSDELALASPVTTTCPIVEGLARWMLEAVTPAANRDLESRPTQIVIGTSYECRSRNRQEGAKLSEHAFADAIDIMGFRFHTGKAMQVGSLAAETPEGRFQAAIRGEACRYFTTVLGPGSDESHKDHLHLDLRGRNKGFRLCQ